MSAMSKLLTFLNTLDTDEQERFARRCGTSVGYIRKAVSSGQKFGPSLCLRFEKETGGAVKCADMNEEFAKDLLRAGYSKKAA